MKLTEGYDVSSPPPPTSIVSSVSLIVHYYTTKSTLFTTLFFTRPLKMMPNPAWISALEGQLKENPKSVCEFEPGIDPG
jgi:hypothetical protein